MFCGIWVHLGSFRNCMKLVAKHSELVQLIHKFMPRSHVVIFRNKSTWSTPLDSKHMFWCVSYHFGAFGIVFWTTKLGVERDELVQLLQNFVPWSHIGIFPNERSRSSPFDSKLIYWCISYRLAAFETVSLLHDTIRKTGRSLAINAKVNATKSRRNFSQRTLPTHTNRP